MEKKLKVWIYREGWKPMVHDGPLNDIYGIEGQFIDEMESRKSDFIARHPDEAHLFLIPISVVRVVELLYKPLGTYSRDPLQRVVLDYVRFVADKYPYWNRSRGADHFLLSCHDWAPDISLADANLFKNFIRVLCNANTSEGFKPKRDVSIPEINIPRKKLGPPLLSRPPNRRPIFAFFAGGAHGDIRNMLLEHWKDRDSDVQVHEYLDKKENYFNLMGRSKFCLCPSGFEVASPRVVTAIYVGCVPVIISDNYTLPFSDVLNWKKFSIQIPSQEIPEIKNILKRGSYNKYLRMQKRVVQVQKHFVINRPAKPFDMIHMVLHSVWLRRLNFRLPS
nr:probable glycosyltransferase At5g20260 [Ziziphus jujuba var. spinosa]